MAENEEPALGFVNDNGHLRFRRETVRVHGIIREIIRASMLSAGKKVRIAYFYQNNSYDSIIPFCLELLYQNNVVSKKRRYRVLLYCGKQYSPLKRTYKNTYYGSGNYCNHLFGLGVVTPRGSIKEEKKIFSKGHKTTKDCEDKFLFSSSYSFFPKDNIAKTISSVVIIPPSISNMHKIPQICQWCEEHGISNISIFDPYPTARKIKFYGNLGFIAYGWSIKELEEAARLSKEKNPTPLSNPVSLTFNSENDHVKILTVEKNELSPLFNSLNGALSKAHKMKEKNYYEKDLLAEAVSLSRRLASLSCPLLEYDKEFFGSMFRKPLSEKVDNFSSMVQAAASNKGASSEMGKAAYYLIQIKIELTKNCPKFNELVTIISSSISKGLKTVIFVPSKKERDALAHSLSDLKIPITIEQMHHAGIKIKSFGENKRSENETYDKAILTTYPFLDKRNLLSKKVAKETKMLLYPCEKSDYKFFNSLYYQIEENFFNKPRREEIRSFLAGGSSLKDIKIKKISRKGSEADTKLEYKKRKPKDILSVLTDIEKSLDVTSPSLFQESLSKSSIKKGISGELKTSGLLVKFHTKNQLYVREDKTVQVLSASDDINLKLAKDLKVGETLVLINRDLRMSFNELILEKAEEYPKLKVLNAMVDIWKNALKKGMVRENDNENDLLEKMKEHGSKIKSKYTIKNWVNGEVIGPRDLKNILRIADIYNSESLGKNAKSVARAITKMRGLRRTILRRAKDALVEGKDKDFEKLGIDLTDFSDAIEFFRITSIEKKDDIPIEQLDRIGGGYEI